MTWGLFGQICLLLLVAAILAGVVGENLIDHWHERKAK